MPALADVQRWLFTYITEPGTRAEAVAEAGRQTGLTPEGMVLPSPRLAPAERIAIYRNMYLLRMEEALEVDYGMVQKALGPEKFFELVEEYVKVHPSRSWTLNHLGRHFPEFVAQAGFLGRQRSALGELARLEWALCEVFDAERSPVLDPAGLAGFPPERFVDLRFEPIPSLRLLALRYPVNAALVALRDDEPWQGLKRKDTWLLTWRDQDFTVWRRDLSRAEHDLLQALVQGKTLGEAIEETLRHRRVSGLRLFEWCSSWVASGLFQRAYFAK